MKFSVYGTAERTIKVEADSPHEAAAKIRAEGFTPVNIEQLEHDSPFTIDFQSVGKCMSCGMELFSTDGFTPCDEGEVMICDKCNTN